MPKQRCLVIDERRIRRADQSKRNRDREEGREKKKKVGEGRKGGSFRKTTWGGNMSTEEGEET
eukprot:3465618-Rhodomonas_salina.1